MAYTEQNVERLQFIWQYIYICREYLRKNPGIYFENKKIKIIIHIQ